MHMSSQRYINVASENIYICILIYNIFCSATFYNDSPVITHAVAQEVGPQEVKLRNYSAHIIILALVRHSKLKCEKQLLRLYGRQ